MGKKHLDHELFTWLLLCWFDGVLVMLLLQQSLRGGPRAETSSDSNGTGVNWDRRADRQVLGRGCRRAGFLYLLLSIRKNTLGPKYCY